jgi:hypothetical protein
VSHFLGFPDLRNMTINSTPRIMRLTRLFWSLPTSGGWNSKFLVISYAGRIFLESCGQLSMIFDPVCLSDLGFLWLNSTIGKPVISVL